MTLQSLIIITFKVLILTRVKQIIMNRTIVYFILFLLHGSLRAQQVIDIPYAKAPENIAWSNPEGSEYSAEWKVTVVANVSVPRLIYYPPNAKKATGSAVIIFPGGGFHALNLETEGPTVAQWLAENGIAAFVLKYRVIPTYGDALQEFAAKEAKGTLESEIDSFRPLAFGDALSAMDYVRKKASSLGIDKNRIGVIGFSAGGTLAMEMVFQEQVTSKPDFVAPVYADFTPFLDLDVPDNSPPLFVLATSDDNAGTIAQCVDIYNRWLSKGLSSEIHMYSTGGHGFGYRKDETPLSNWIKTFGDWLTTIGWMTTPKFK